MDDSVLILVGGLSHLAVFVLGMYMGWRRSTDQPPLPDWPSEHSQGDPPEEDDLQTFTEPRDWTL